MSDGCRVADDDVPLSDRLRGANTVLLLSGPMEPAGRETCLDLSRPASPDATNLLCIEFVRTGAARLRDWDDRAEARPAELAILSAAGDPRGGSDPAVETVSDPGDLTTLGIRTTERLEEWRGNDNRTAVCVHSLTDLLQFVDAERAYRFVHTLTGRFRATDAVTHLHLDPAAHGERTLNTFASLADAIVEVGDDGHRSVRTRSGAVATDG